MDSLTQITLGAAVGEAVLGRKIGNRAMLYGAIGGTIPDLDVLGNLFMGEMDSLAFHRGISHSFFFATLVPFALAWLTERLYSSNLYRKKAFKASTLAFWILLYCLAALGLNLLPLMVGGSINPTFLGFCVAGGLLVATWLYRGYYNKALDEVRVSYKQWYWLFFWSIFTHPILDSFTAYGTQLFLPFSDYRVAFNTISVVDPIYTVPFILCLLFAGRLGKQSLWRMRLNYLGIGLSSAYLIFTIWNKHRVDKVFENSLEAQGITYQRYMTAPTIFNNLLWNCIAEGDSVYYQSLYSVLDKEAKIIQFNIISKGHHYLKPYEGQKAERILTWFSNDYYNVMRRKDGRLQFNDLRYGSTTENFGNENDYVFRFILINENGKLDAEQTREGNIEGEKMERMFARMWGNK